MSRRSSRRAAAKVKSYVERDDGDMFERGGRRGDEDSDDFDPGQVNDEDDDYVVEGDADDEDFEPDAGPGSSTKTRSKSVGSKKEGSSRLHSIFYGIWSAILLR